MFDDTGKTIDYYSPSANVKNVEYPHISWLVQNATISQQLRDDYQTPTFVRAASDLNDFGPEYFFIALKEGFGRTSHIDHRYCL